MKRAPRVVIPPPTQKCPKSTVCRREQRVRRRRAPALRKPFFCRNKPRAGLFRHSHSNRRVSDTPHTEMPKKCKAGVLSPPPTGLPPKPSEAVSVGRGRATERASPAACDGTRDSSSARTTARDSSSARTTASIAFVWSAAKPLPCQTLWAGHGPTPHFRAEARTHLRPPALQGDERNHFRKVIDYEKRYQIQHAHGVRRP